MPLYRFRCKKCKLDFDEFCRFEDVEKVRCDCGARVHKLLSAPNLVTDTNFAMTGMYDKRLGCKIEGRKHFAREIKKKGYCELSNTDIKNFED